MSALKPTIWAAFMEDTAPAAAGRDPDFTGVKSECLALAMTITLS